MKKVIGQAIATIMLATIALTGCSNKSDDYIGVTPEIANEKVEGTTAKDFKALGLNISGLAVDSTSTQVLAINSDDVETLTASGLNEKKGNYKKFINQAQQDGWALMDDVDNETTRSVVLSRDGWIISAVTHRKEIPGVEALIYSHSLTATKEATE